MSANLNLIPEAANVLKIAGAELPGIVTVSGAGLHNKLDVKQGNGTSGATVTYQGEEPKSFKVEVHLLTIDHYAAWLDGDVRKTLLTPPTGKNPKAFSVENTLLQEVGINSAITQSVSQPEPVGDGSWKVTIELMPYKPPKPSSGTPVGSKQYHNAPDARDAYDKQIDALNAQAKALG